MFRLSKMISKPVINRVIVVIFQNSSLLMLSKMLLSRHSKMTLPHKYQILDPPSPYVTVSHFFHYTYHLSPLSPGK